ncbi:hypothetical protein ACJ73_05053 [Blastomyces percursus]|uniref:Bromo domain-containing protein n=1 Tax=Blastomyces percursus TaxID=1658174 RepID=A0A1J9R7G7_9EURO|nr:hypothetical protein ACJ73_05053 [Blastomyces percursus]
MSLALRHPKKRRFHRFSISRFFQEIHLPSSTPQTSPSSDIPRAFVTVGDTMMLPACASTRPTPTVAPIVKDNNAQSSRFDWQWGMPSLSSYTPFESLLFFQFLNTLDSQPSNFTPISELLINNSFVRQNATFDKSRLTPQALEALYINLVQEELQNSEGTPEHGSNGYNSDAVNANPKKRKIQDPSSKHEGASYSTVIPTLVARLYARYKERATREIEDEERRYARIKDEIKKLENAETAKHTPPILDGSSVALEISKEVAQPKPSSPQPATFAPRVNIEQPRDQVLEQAQAVQIPKYAQPGLVEGQAALQQALQAEGKLANAPRPSPQNPQAQQWQQAGPQAIAQNIPPCSIAPNLGNGNGPMLPSQDHISSGDLQYATSKSGQPGISTSTIPHAGAGRALGQVLTPATSATSQASPPSLQPTPTATSAQQQQQQQQRIMATFQPVQYSPPQSQMTQTSPNTNYQKRWSPQPSPSTTYAQISPYANVPYSNSQLPGKSHLPLGPHRPYVQLEAGKSFQGPSGPSLQPSRPVGLELPQQIQNDAGTQTTPHEQHLATPVSTPGAGGLDRYTPSFSAALNRRPPRPSLETSGSLTPWKKPSPIVISKSPGSPIRPRPEDVSPISERAPSPATEVEMPSISKTRPKDQTVHADDDSSPARNTRQRKSTPALRGRATASPVSSPIRANRSRSQGARSNVSRDDESITDTGSVTQQKIKREMPSTPAGISDETEVELRVSRRLKAPSQAQADEFVPKGRGKRKRGPSEAEDAIQPPTRQAAQYVQCTRNFPRTCAPIMNDIASHKYASIFAKPLTERDAPGYKSLIYRPQDIKSIKSAIHQGSKAVAAATEAINTTSGENTESPGPAQGLGTTPLKSNGLLLRRTAELTPPKGIVNSAQLEMELVRMFANAVMFNPTSEKTFGPSFLMQSDWASREGTQVSDMDEGGIINDTLEMYDDVEKAVSSWRAAERAVDDLGGKSMTSLRRGSASDINMDSADEVK